MLRQAAYLCLLLGVLALGFAINVGTAPADPPPAQYLPGEVILKFKGNASEQDKAQIYAELGGAKIKGLGHIKAELRRVETMSVEDAIGRYHAHPKVEYIEPNYVLTADEIPNDPLFPQLYGLHNTGQTGGTADADIDAAEAWDVFNGSSSVLLGVIDTGVDYNHPDLAANIWTNPGEIPGNAIDDDANGFVDDVHGYDFINNDGDPMDDNGHGSHCSGTIGGVGDNGIGVAGVNWNVKIMGLKFLSSGGSGSTADAVEAINYATMMGVRLTSNSWGGGGFSQAMLDAINAANAAGILFVAAAGNSSANTDVSPHYPSSYNAPNVVAVAATDHNDNLASFSNYGATTVDLAAPGVNIWSTTPGNNYQSFSGTSMATPHVAGAFGLVFGRFPAIGHLDAKNLILNFVDVKASLAGKCVTGGRLNAFFPIADPDDTAPGAVTDLAVSTVGSNWATIGWTAVGDDGYVGTASSYIVKYSTLPISDANFATAQTAPNPPDPGPAGASESMTIYGLDFSTVYYFAVKARDEFGNEDGVSNPATGTTLGAPDIDVSPTSLAETLLSGGSSSQSLTLSNLAEGTLDFTVPLPDLITNPLGPQIYTAHGKDDPDLRVGNPVVEGTGGPDGFGYRWVDSDEPFGPPFVWDDIAGVGTVAIATGDDVNSGPFPLGFDFSFYGVTYDQFRVSSNGWLSFTSTSTAYDNQPLPNAGAPVNLVAPFWDDLNLTAGDVFYHNDGSRLIVQWNDIPHYSAGGPYTFQAVLYPDGTIEYYYLSMTDPLASATVGIQNATGSDGLTVAFNTAYIHDNLAVRIQAVPQWVTVSPTSGTVFAPGSTDLSVNFETLGLLGGTYEANVRILSNDPDEPSVTVPVTLTVVGAPDVAIAPASFDFGQVFVNGMPSTTVLVQNPGTDVLHVSSVTVDNGAYAVSPAMFDVPPHGAQAVTVTFHPLAVGLYPATLTVASDDPDEPTVSMTLAGEGVTPPAFSVSPTSLSEALFTGQTAMHQVTLSNGGGAPLTYSLGVDLGTEVLVYPDMDLEKGEENPNPGVLGSGGPDTFGYSWKDSDDPGGPAFDWTDISATGTPVAINGDDVISTPIDIGFNFPFYGNTFGSLRVSSNGWVSFTSAATGAASRNNLVMPTGGTVAPENLVAAFWDDLHFRSVQRARYLNDGTRLIIQFTDVERFATSPPSLLTFQIILYPNGAIVYQYLSMTGVLNSAAIGIQNGTRTDGLTVVNNANYVHNNLAIRFQAAPDWLSASPVAGSIPPGGSQIVDVTFNATDLFGGLYEGGLDITTNDPLAPTVRVPAVLDVTGAPNLEVSTSAIDFGVVYVGYPDVHQFQVFNTGTDVLTITAVSADDPEFTPDLTQTPLPIHLAPLTGTLLAARFAPVAPGMQSATLSIASNDPDSPTTLMALSGNGLLPPMAGVTPGSLSSSLYTGDTETQTVMLANTGASDLAFEIESFTSLGIEALPEDPAGFDPGKDDPDPRPGILGSGGPDAFGYSWTDSDEPNGPPYNWIDISGTGTAVFAGRSDDVNTGPFPIGFNFPFYGNLFSQFRISSNGFLSFTSTASDLSNDPLPSVNAPTDLIAALWDDLLVDPALGGQVFYESSPARLIVQWNNVQKYSEQGGPRFTFQVILFRNGTILTQYEALGTTTNSLTVGIQNGTRDVGLTTVYNALYVDTNLAVRFSTFPDWLSANPTSGVIPPGGSLPIEALFNAAGLFGGNYEGALRILSNDPTSGVIQVPATLNVTGVPVLDLSVASLDFGEAFVGYPESLTLVASNLGTDLLQVSSVMAGLPDYSANPAMFDLEPYESQVVTVTFGPTTDGDRSTDLMFQSNDPDAPHTVALIGTGLFPPIIGTSPEMVVGTAAPGGQKTKPLTVCNTGGSDLNFTVAWAEVSATATVVHEELLLPKQEDVPGSTESVDPRPGILGTGGPDAFGYSWVDSDDPAGPAFDWMDISGVGTQVTDFGIYTDDGTHGPYPIGFNFSFYGNTFTEFNLCSNGWLSFTEGSLTTFTNQPLPNSGTASPANLLAVFWDDMVYDEADDSAIYYYNDGNRLIVQYYVRRIAQGSPPYYLFQIILYPNGNIVYQYHTLGTTQNSATIGIQNGTKDDGLTVVYNDTYVHENLAVQFSTRPGWLSVSPEAGTVPAGECMDLSVLMNAAELDPGVYEGVIHIASNDPAMPTDSTPVEFRVCVVEAAFMDVDPNTLNITANGNFITCHVELPAGYDPSQIVLDTVRLNGTVAASPNFFEIGDWNDNGVPDLMIKFLRAEVEEVLPEGDLVPVTVTGEIQDLCTFTGTDTIRHIRPNMNHPNGGETFIAGSRQMLEWTNPQGWDVEYAQVYYSLDGGDSWTLLAENVVGQSTVWAVPEQLTENGRLRVYIFDAAGIMGYDSSDGDFAIRTASTGLEGVLPSVHRLHQNSPNPFLSATKVAFDLPVEGKVMLKVYDLGGREVRVLADTWYPAGSHQTDWDGRDTAGRTVAGGIYFLHIEAGSFTDTKRMSLRR